MNAAVATRIGDDGLARCAWCTGSELERRYHDLEWGRPLRDERGLFEALTLEAFQSGLSWRTILAKREAFRRAFAGFDAARVARFRPRDVTRLLADTGIVRHRGKIEATIANARAVLALRESGGSLAELAWRFAPPRTRAAAADPGVPTEATALSRALKAHGFAFVGPTTAYAFMQAAGLVDDHAEGCHARGAIDRESAAAG